MIVNGKTYIPISVASKRLNLSNERVRQLAVNEGKISYTRISAKGWIWVYERDVMALSHVYSIDKNGHENELNN